MNILIKIEDILNKVVPKLGVKDKIDLSINQDTFNKIMSKITQSKEVNVRSSSDTTFDFIFHGNTFGNLDFEVANKAITGKEIEPNKMNRYKSRIICRLLPNSIIEVESFEHLLGFPSEKRAFKVVLENRLKHFVEKFKNLSLSTEII